jgi:hypothetical protein
MDETPKPPPGPWDRTQPPDLADDAAKAPGAGLRLMIGVVAALLLAAILGWVVLGRSVVS